MTVTRKDLKDAEVFWKFKIKRFDENSELLNRKVKTPTDLFNLREEYLKMLDDYKVNN